MDSPNIEQSGNQSLKNSYIVLQNVLQSMNTKNSPTTVKGINKLLNATKRLQMANILYKEECKEHKHFLKKYIKKSKFNMQKRTSNMNHSIQQKPIQQIQKKSSSYEEQKQQIKDQKQIIKHIVDEKKYKNDIMEVEESQSNNQNPNESDLYNIQILEKMQDDEIKNIIKQKFNFLQLKNDLEKNNNNQQDNIFKNLCFKIHNVSQSACKQAQGLYNKIRITIQNLLQEQDIISLQQSSYWYKNVIDLFQIEQKQFKQSLKELKQKTITFQIEDLKYDSQFCKQRTFIDIIEKKSENELYLYTHELYQSKITVKKYPNLKQDAKIGELYVGTSDILQFELFSHPIQSEEVRSLLLQTSKNQLSLTHFNIKTFESCKRYQPTYFSKVHKFQFQKIQDYFAILYTDKTRIEIFNENGKRVYTYNHNGNNSIISFCFHIDHQNLNLILYLDNFSVQYNTISFDAYNPLSAKSYIKKEIYKTNLYLENSKVPSSLDEPDIYFLDDEKFYLQFQNKMNIIKIIDIEIGVLNYDFMDLIDQVLHKNCVFRIYKNDITVQYYDSSKVYKEISIFTQQQQISLKQASIICLNEENLSFQIDIVNFQNLSYTFYYSLEE